MVDVNEKEVADFGLYLSAEASETLPKIEKQARDEGMNSDGFGDNDICLLYRLGQIVEGSASDLVGTGFVEMQKKLCDFGDHMINIAEEYGHMEEDNRKLFERNELSDSNDEPTTGSGYGDADGYDRHSKDGSSEYELTPLDIKSISRKDTDYRNDLDTGGVLSILDWIWSEFPIPGSSGKGFTDDIINPLAGNYNSISANGKAWENVGENFGLLASWLGDNATTLMTNHWQDAGAQAFEQFFDLFWHRGAVWAGKKVGGFVGKGFDKIGEVSKKIAQLAINVIKQLLRVARRIATKAIPVIGWAWTAIESAAKLLGFDVDALWNDIQEIIELAQAVFSLFDSVKNVVETMENYFDSVQELIASVEKIPDVGSLKDAALLNDEISEKKTEFDKQKKELEDNLDEAGEALDDLDDIATGAEDEHG